MPTSVEVWKPVVGYEGLYEVSDQGRVRSLDRKFINARGQRRTCKGRILSQSLVEGYPQVALCSWGHMRLRKVHQLVLESFTGPRPGVGWDACHCDGIKTNNAIGNLRWDTKQANQADRVLHGTDSRGVKCKTAKLTEQQVLEIRASSLRYREIADLYGIGISTVGRIKNQKSWAWL